MAYVFMSGLVRNREVRCAAWSEHTSFSVQRALVDAIAVRALKGVFGIILVLVLVRFFLSLVQWET